MDLELLLEGLASPDPVVRDETAYGELVGRIRMGEFDDRLAEIGDVMMRRFEHPEIQARTFAPLILAAMVDRSIVDAGILLRWREAFATWWLAEDDLRGWDEKLGWLHAIAHGADLAGALGVALPVAEAGELLLLVAERTTAGTDYRYAQMEEDRLARAVGRILSRDDLTAEAATGWLEVIDRLFAAAGRGPLPVPMANTLAMLKATYIIADRGGAPCGPAVADAIAERLHLAFPAYPAARVRS